MKVKIRRFKEGKFTIDEYNVDDFRGFTVLDLLIEIKERIDPSLSFRCMCRAGICGTCAVKVNGTPKLACNTPVDGEEILIEPMDLFKPVKDLVVDFEYLPYLLKTYRVWIKPLEENVNLSKADIALTQKAWDCILCGICNSVCPPLVEGKDFGSPLLATRLCKVLEDKRNRDYDISILKGFHPRACVHCSNCTLMCPKGCMPEKWINVIENKLVQAGLLERKMDDFGFLGF